MSAYGAFLKKIRNLFNEICLRIGSKLCNFLHISPVKTPYNSIKLMSKQRMAPNFRQSMLRFLMGMSGVNLPNFVKRSSIYFWRKKYRLWSVRKLKKMTSKKPFLKLLTALKINGKKTLKLLLRLDSLKPLTLHQPHS